MKLTTRIVNEYAAENNLTIVQINGWRPLDNPNATAKLNFGNIIKLGENVGRRGVNYRVFQTNSYLLLDVAHGIPGDPIDMNITSNISCLASEFNAIAAREDARQSIDDFIDHCCGFEYIDYEFFNFEYLRPHFEQESTANAELIFRLICTRFEMNLDESLKDAEGKTLTRVLNTMQERQQITNDQHDSIMVALNILYSKVMSPINYAIQEIATRYSEKSRYNGYAEKFKSEQKFLSSLREDNYLYENDYKACMTFLDKLYADA